MVQVRGDGVQVLVELTGQTANNRLGVMAMQAAPVQVTWIGYPNSTGLKAVHYRLTGVTHHTVCVTSLCDPSQWQLHTSSQAPVVFDSVQVVMLLHAHHHCSCALT